MDIVLQFKAVSNVPMLMHSATTVDPLHPLTRELKKVSAKRKKVDADHEEMARIEFIAGLYFDEELGPFIPAANIDSMMVEAAKKLRLGKQFSASVFTVNDVPLKYDGPRTVEELYADDRFKHRCMVRVTTNRIMRTRPQFYNWELSVPIMLIEGAEIDKAQIIEVAEIAAERIGLGDWRPRFGRFTVVT